MTRNEVELYAADMPFPEGPCFGPDGLLYVCCRRHGWIAKVLEDRSVIRLCETGGKPQALALSPDGKQMYLADAVRRQILTLGIDGRLETIIDDPQLIGPNDLTFGPVSGDLYFTDPGNEWGVYSGNVYRWSLADRKLVRLAQNLGFPNGLAVSADEKTLIVAESLSDRLLGIDLAKPAEAEVLYQFPAGSIPDGMKWLNDGRLAVALHGSAGIHNDGNAAAGIAIVDVRYGKHLMLSLPCNAAPTNLTICDDAMYVTDDGVQGVYRIPLSVLEKHEDA